MATRNHTNHAVFVIIDGEPRIVSGHASATSAAQHASGHVAAGKRAYSAVLNTTSIITPVARRRR